MMINAIPGLLFGSGLAVVICFAGAETGNIRYNIAAAILGLVAMFLGAKMYRE